jgi:FlaA1/EpsC-like NDP-sugar epimerase
MVSLNQFKELYSGDNSLKLLDQKYLPRWMVVILDTILCVISLFLVYFIVLGSPIRFLDVISLPAQGFIILGVNLVYFYLFKTYSGIIRHSTLIDILKLIISSFSTAATLIIFNYFYEFFIGSKLFITTSLLLYMFLSFTILFLFRIAVKESYQLLKNNAVGSHAKRVAIFGVDDHSISLGNALTTESNLPFYLVGFISNKIEHKKKFRILGKNVIPIEKDFSTTISKLDLDGVLIISESMSGKEKNEIVQDCLDNDLEVFNVPILETWNKK